MAKRSRHRYRKRGKKTKTRKRKNVIRGGIALTPLKTALLAYLFQFAQNKDIIKQQNDAVTSKDQYDILNKPDIYNQLNIAIQKNPPKFDENPDFKDIDFKHFNFEIELPGIQTIKTIDAQKEAQLKGNLDKYDKLDL
jgi:hypothetical protein